MGVKTGSDQLDVDKPETLDAGDQKDTQGKTAAQVRESAGQNDNDAAKEDEPLVYGKELNEGPGNIEGIEHELSALSAENAKTDLGVQDHEKKKRGSLSETSPSRVTDENEDAIVELQQKLTLKDEEIKNLRGGIHGLQTTHEHTVEGVEAAASQKIEDLQTELAHVSDQLLEANNAQRSSLHEREELLQTKDREINELKANIRDSQNVQALGELKEQELEDARHVISVKEAEIVSLQSQIQDLETVHKSELDEVEDAASSHREALQSEFDKLLQSRDWELEEAKAAAKNASEIHGIFEMKDQELNDAISLNESRSAEINTLQIRVQELQDTIEARVEEVELKASVQLKDNQAKHRDVLRSRDIEITEMTEMVQSFKSEIDSAHTAQEQTLRDALLKHEQQLRDLNLEHERELGELAETLEQEQKNTAMKHETDLAEAIQKHRSDRQNAILKHEEAYQKQTDSVEQRTQDIAMRYEKEINEATIRHEQEIRTLTAGNEDLASAARKHEQELEDLTASHRQLLADVVASHEQKLQSADTESKREIDNLRHECEAASLKIASLNSKIRKSDLEKYAGESEMISGHKRELEEAALKYEQETQQLHEKYEAATRQAASLRDTLDQSDLERSRANADAAWKDEQELKAAASKHEETVTQLRHKYQSSIDEALSAKAVLENLVLNQSREIETLKQNQEERAAAMIQDHERQLLDAEKTTAEEVTNLTMELKDLEIKRTEAVREADEMKVTLGSHRIERDEAIEEIQSLKAVLSELSIELFNAEEIVSPQAVEDDTNLKPRGLILAIATLKNNIQLAKAQQNQDKETIAALQNNLDGLQNQDISLEQKENSIDVALLKDKLELAEIQNEKDKETIVSLQNAIEEIKVQHTELEQDEKNVEIALLRDKWELAGLKRDKDKEDILALQETLQGSQGSQGQRNMPPNEGRLFCYQLREETALLGRQHDASLADLVALRSDMATANKKREQEWRRLAEIRSTFAGELRDFAAGL